MPPSRSFFCAHGAPALKHPGGDVSRISRSKAQGTSLAASSFASISSFSCTSDERFVSVAPKVGQPLLSSYGTQVLLPKDPVVGAIKYNFWSRTLFRVDEVSQTIPAAVEKFPNNLGFFLDYSEVLNFIIFYMRITGVYLREDQQFI